VRRSDALAAHLRQLSIVCVAILVGVLVFTGVVWYLLGSGDLPPQDRGLPSWLGPLLNLVGLVALVKAYFLPRLLAAPEPGAPEKTVLAWHKKTTIVGFALREAAAFIALVGALLTGRLTGAVTVVGLALFTMILAWPRAAQIENR